MATITIELPDETYRELAQHAQSAMFTVEQLVAELANEQARSLREGAIAPDVLSTMDQLIDEYRPVFHRLAQ